MYILLFISKDQGYVCINSENHSQINLHANKQFAITFLILDFKRPEGQSVKRSKRFVAKLCTYILN